ncbi:hypothetical protein E4U30_008080 [Claviceps sp. LM220 group G6]|nr:hypothetical protein E4U30_008080 [Claviceps sp. LM220 group G6]
MPLSDIPRFASILPGQHNSRYLSPGPNPNGCVYKPAPPPRPHHRRALGHGSLSLTGCLTSNWPRDSAAPSERNIPVAWACLFFYYWHMFCIESASRGRSSCADFRRVVRMPRTRSALEWLSTIGGNPVELGPR